MGIPMVGIVARRLYETAHTEETPVPLGEPKRNKAGDTLTDGAWDPGIPEI
jgi:hypothetical protein